MLSELDVYAILREADVELLVASRISLEPYEVIAQQIGEAISRLYPEEVTKDYMTKLISEIWQKAFDLNEEDLKQRIPKFEPIINAIIEEADKAQELDPS